MRSLAELRDIRLPAPAGDLLADWPDATTVVFVLVLALAVSAILAALARRRGSGARLARADLAAAEKEWHARGDRPRLARLLSGLVRRRIARRDPAAVAVAGEQWRRLLEAAGLTVATAAALATEPYRAPGAANGDPGSRADGDRWIAEVRSWLQTTS